MFENDDDRPAFRPAGPRDAKLIELWNRLTITQRDEVLEHASRLYCCGLIIGGPHDGGRLTIPDDDWRGWEFDEGFEHTWDQGQGALAVYTVDAKGSLVFTGFETQNANHPEG